MVRYSLLFLCSLAWATQVFAQQKINYVVIDGKSYQGEQLKWAASHPNSVTAPYLDKGNWYVVPRSADGHYWIPAFINGFPVTFLLDTGATKTSIGARIAKNSGIRAGVSAQIGTANGIGSAMQSEGNYLQVGAFTLSDVPVMVSLNQANADMALLGMDVLRHFRIFQGQDSIQLQRLN